MASKNKGGRENRKPKQDKNKRVSGQTPVAGVLEAIKHPSASKG